MRYSKLVPLGTRQRRVLLGSGLLLVGIIILWLACPIWFPWLLRPLASAFGVHYNHYAREGFSSFAFSEVRFTSRSESIAAGKVEALLPTTWLWRIAFGEPSGPHPFLTVDEWSYSPIPSTNQVTATATDSSIRDVQAAMKVLSRWVPNATLSNGKVQVGGRQFALPIVSWAAPRLDARLVWPSPESTVLLSGDFREPSATLHIESASLHLASTIHITNTISGTELHSSNNWWSNQVELQAHFARSGQLPETASFKIADLHVPAELLGVPAYQTIAGSASGTWTKGAFTSSMDATASTTVRTGLPPVRLQLQARGNTNSATLTTARISSSWIQADISRPLAISFKDTILRQPVTLNVTADLDRQDWFPVHGTLQGTAEFEPTTAKLPQVRFSLSGSDIGNEQLTATALRLQGNFDWPWLALSEAQADFDDGSSASLSGRLDVEKKISSGAQLKFGGGLARHWLPPNYSFKSLSLGAHFEGPLTNLVHDGQLEITEVAVPGLKPAHLQGKWNGRQLSLDHFTVQAGIGNSSIQTEGALNIASKAITLRLEKLALFSNQQSVLELFHPSSVSITRASAGSGWQLDVSQIEWSGLSGKIQIQGFVQWPAEGTVQLSIDKVTSAMAADCLEKPLPDVQIDNLFAKVGWTNTPMSFEIKSSITMSDSAATIAGGRSTSEAQPLKPVEARGSSLPLKAKLELSGDENGINISNLLVLSRTSNVVEMHGFLPLALAPFTPTNFLRFESNKPISVVASAAPHAFFWNELAAVSGVVLSQPDLQLNLSGTWEAPSGAIILGARELRSRSAATNLPAIDDVRMELRLNPQEAELTKGHFLVQGQPVTLTGQVPLGPDFWRKLSEKKPPDWKKASARLQIADAALKAFEPLFPTILAPDGLLDLDLSLSPGGKFSGEMRLQNARTRPLGELGPVRHIDVDLQILDRTVRLKSATAEISASAIKLSGQGDLSGSQWLHGELPPFTLTVYGTNVPLVRQAEAVVRSDFQLAINKTNGAPPIIAGLARLRDSFFLADLTALIPGKVASPTRRPPYFSIEDPFVADWRLAVSVQGTRFLKVRTPLFNGEVSANLKMQGTLKDPIALGDLRIDSGAVRFPFGSLEVQQGLVTLTSQDPYHPQLSVSAAS